LYWFIKETPIQQGGSDSPSLKRARTDSPEVPAESPVAAVSEEATGAPPEVIAESGTSAEVPAAPAVAAVSEEVPAAPAVAAESGTSAEVAPTTKDYQEQNNQKLRTTKI